MPFSSLKNSFSASRRLVGLHAGRRAGTGRRPAACRTPEPGAVGVAVLLAQVLVQPRRERAAEDRVQHLQREVVGRRARDADAADADLRLRGARLVDEVHLPRGQLQARRSAPAPAPRLPRPSTPPNAALELADDRVGLHVADHDQRGTVGPVLRPVEGAEVVDREAADRRRRPGERGAVAMLSEHDLGNDRPAIDAGSSRAWSIEVRRSLRSRSSSAAGKVGRRATSAITGSASARRATGTQSRTADESKLPVVRSVAPRKSTASAISSALRFPAPSSSIADVMLATPNLPAGSGAPAGHHDQAHLDDRHLVQLDDPDRHAVRQRALLDRRQLQRGRRARCRGLRRSGGWA